MSEQRKPLLRSTRELLLESGQRGRFPAFATHPHMLRHACGFALADQGVAYTRLIQDYLGHRKIEHTVKYTVTNPARF